MGKAARIQKEKNTLTEEELLQRLPKKMEPNINLEKITLPVDHQSAPRIIIKETIKAPAEPKRFPVISAPTASE